MIKNRTTLLAILSVLFSVLAPSAQAAEKPNIILLMGDDHGLEETGYNGHPDLKTPAKGRTAACNF